MAHISAPHRRGLSAVLLFGLLTLPVTGTAETSPPATPASEDIPALYRKPVSAWPAPTINDGVQWQELSALPQPERRVPNATEALGRELFFDPVLSDSGQIACASCHDPALGWADGRPVPFGHARAPGTRNAPTVLNSGMLKALFWDGRAPSLEAQVIGPLTAMDEMHHQPQGAVERLQADPDYRERFATAFGDPQISYARVASAIAAFERTLVSRRSRFDKFVEGDYDALDDTEIRGLHWFRTQARCMNCHNGPLLTDQQFHNIGLHFLGRTLQDTGRYEVTHRAEDVGAFRTPQLRDIAYTGPYMHNGLFTSLEGVINMYNAGGARPREREDRDYPAPFPEISPLLEPLNLDTPQRADIVAFLEALSTRPTRIGPIERRSLRLRALNGTPPSAEAPSDTVPIRALPTPANR